MQIPCKLGSSPSLNHCYSWKYKQKHDFVQLFLSETSIQQIDADDDDGGASTIFLAWPSPYPNACRDKISRKGKPLTLIRQIIDGSSIGCSCPWIFTNFLNFSTRNPMPCGKPWIGSPRPRHELHASARPSLIPQAGLAPTVCGAQKAVTYEIFIFSIEFQCK